ncbi:ras guanine nucleotide exchange factor domain-containing protein [Dichotomocladium elegans]|nr:ras guanine nucleotide exchange factor domain-containing protein [Dichotomocladium elegans]
MTVHPALIDSPLTPPKTSVPSSLSPPVSLPNSPRNDTTPSTLTSHFVQALHDYLPTSAAVDEAVSCLYFRKGAIIEVINRDPSGWWDGTTNGARGWFPSNFVGRIGEATQHYSSDDENDDTVGTDEDDNTRQKKAPSNLLSTTRVLDKHVQSKTIQPHRWDELMTDVARHVQTLLDDPDDQTLVYPIVAAVRAVLAAAEAVSTDAPIFKSNPDLAKYRKSILASLSRLIVLSRKEPQATPPEDGNHDDDEDDANAICRQLTKDLNQFEVAFKKTKSARLSSASLIARAVPLDDAKHTLKNLADHQSTIQNMVDDLLETIRLFLAVDDGLSAAAEPTPQPKATEMLKKTRDAVDAVRHFLAVVEHVCSTVGNLDYGHHSIIPQDPNLVALVLAKETVYSAITRLVTGVRALAGNPAKEDLDAVEHNCRTVADAILDCQQRVKVCLEVGSDSDSSSDASNLQQQQEDAESMRQQLEESIETRRQQTLSVLGRKATTLDALHDHYHAEQQQQQQSYQKHTSEIRRSRALSRVSRTTSPLPPRPASSKSTPAAPDRTRRQRGMSVSSVKQRSDSLASSTETLVEVPQGALRRTPSWLSVSEVTERRDSLQSVSPTPKNDTEPWFLKQRAFTDDEIMLNSEGQVTGATVEALIERLTQHEKSTELLFLRAFFYNFRLFTTPPVVLDLLIKRFNLQPPTTEPPLSQDELGLWTNRVLLPVRLRVYNVIKTWLESFFYYESDHAIEPMLVEFVTGPMTHAMATPSKRMMDLVRKRFTSREALNTSRKLSFSSNVSDHVRKQAGPQMSLSSTTSGSLLFSTLFEENSNHSSSSSAYGNGNNGSSSNSNGHPAINQPNINRSLRNTIRKAIGQNALTSVHLTEFDALELARQLTLMESMLFCQIQPNEMIGQEFKKKLGLSTAIHVKAMIQRSTQITSWVSDTILHEADAKKRAQIIKFWIKIGDHCLQLRNYNTLMAIRSALDSTSIARLKRTWEHVSHKYKAMYDPIYRATDSSRNFAEYRRQLRDAVAPCLPFLGVYLTDMTFIDDGNANTRTSPNGAQLINFDKYIKTTRILNEIDQFQIPYKLTEVEEIQRYLLECLETVEKDDQVFYTRSLQLEPREEEFDIKSFISNLA